jgi:Fic-DOC domain mobile mystery protein B
MNVENQDGATPLSPEELADLIPSLGSREELNEWERANILEGRAWAIAANTKAKDLLSDNYIRLLHRKMFDQTWEWAGSYRQTEKNIGVPPAQIREQLAVLLGDVHYWVEHNTYPPDELVVRFHYRLVKIHPFPNGNGRHGRLIADMLAAQLKIPEFTWGSKELVKVGRAREAYLEAMRAADAGDFTRLLQFVRS